MTVQLIAGLWHACPMTHKPIKRVECNECEFGKEPYSNPLTGFEIVCDATNSAEIADMKCAGCNKRHSFLPMEGYCDDCMEENI